MYLKSVFAAYFLKSFVIVFIMIFMFIVEQFKNYNILAIN